ncbi:MAG: hypothetical protein ABIR26_04660 [Ramlibacter sp.]
MPRNPYISLRAFGLAIALVAAHAAQAAAEAPTTQIVEKVMKARWERPASTSTPRSTLTINSVRLGKAYPATVQEVQVEGIPKQEMVTPAVIDFTVRTYFNSETQAVRRVREARVYKDKMDDWAVMTGSPKGADETTKEPAVK